MRLCVAHETTYRYGEPVRSLLQVLRLTPRDHDGQHVLRWRIEPTADGLLDRREDGFGNVVHRFALESPVTEMTIRVTGEIEMADMAGVVRNAVERVPLGVYLRETRLTTPDDALMHFADRFRAPYTAEPLAGLHALLEAINEEVAFDVGPTVTSTTAAEALALRRGVCQDLTHIFLTAARSLGAPARYVSGYFLRGDGVVEQEAGHAWAEARVEGLGWVGFDPANGISTTASHVRIAVGLDYLDAAPIRGARTGGGEETLDVRLTVDGRREAPAFRQTQRQSQE